MIYPLLALVTLLSAVDGAALVRVINTVSSQNPYTGTISTSPYVTSAQTVIDRVGLAYVNDALTSYVWTEFMSPITTAAKSLTEGKDASTGYAYTQAMPPLRQYQKYTTGAAVDRVAIYLNSQLGLNSGLAAAAYVENPATYDNYAQDKLKADGISGYLSFAAGTYRFQPYAVRGTSDGSNKAFTNLVLQQPQAQTSVTFQDGRVYTVVILGDAKWAVTQPSNYYGADFSIKVLEESTDPTTFGKAALRWFHAIKPNRAESMTVYQGEVADNKVVAQTIAYGSVSSYVDVSPATAQLFSVSVPTAGLIAPTSSDRSEVTHDVRAGLRATIICASHSDASPNPFCRMIPSRVVAYVRLINDLAGFTASTIGTVGSSSFNKVKLNVFASSEMPAPYQAVESSQAGAIQTLVNHPLNVHGLYKVLSDVSAGSVTGYAEVFVPLAIMDFAIRWTVVRASPLATTANDVAAAATGTGRTALPANVVVAAAEASPLQWFLGGAYQKRVNFLIRTDGGATISGRYVNNANQNTRDVTANTQWLQATASTDVYVEPGAFYSLCVTPVSDAVNGAALPDTSYVAILGRMDRSVDDVATAVPAGKANVFLNIITPAFKINAAFDAAAIQAYKSANAGASLNFRSKTGAGSATADLSTAPVIGSFFDLRNAHAPVAVNDMNYYWKTAYGSTATSTPTQVLSAGSFSVDHTNTATTVSCYNTVPAFDLTVASGDTVHIFVLNSFGCAMANRRADMTKLTAVAAKPVSAASTGNDVGTLTNPPTGLPASSTSTFFFGAASSNVASIAISALFALVALVFM